jgi:hypothetical protein
MREICVTLGCYTDSLSVQLADTRISAEDLCHYDRDAEAITRLYLRGLLTERERDAARRRLVRQIQKSLTIAERRESDNKVRGHHVLESLE